jgi:hypothetical protein
MGPTFDILFRAMEARAAHWVSKVVPPIITWNDILPALEQARILPVPRNKEVGGFVTPPGLVPIENGAKNPRKEYLPDQKAFDKVCALLDGTPFCGMWHTHPTDAPPSRKDFQAMKEIWEMDGLCMMVITPKRIFVLSESPGRVVFQEKRA